MILPSPNQSLPFKRIRQKRLVSQFLKQFKCVKVPEVTREKPRVFRYPFPPKEQNEPAQ